MKKSKILSLILCAILVIAFASLDASAANQQGKVITYDGNTAVTKHKDGEKLTFTQTTPGENEEEKSSENDQKHYSITSTDDTMQVVFANEPRAIETGDCFVSFDFKLEGDTYLYLWTVPMRQDKVASTNVAMELLKISNNGIQEKAENGILGTETSQETFFSADKIRRNKWNSFQMEICAATGSMNIWLNGEKYAVPVKEQIWLKSETVNEEKKDVYGDLKHSFASFQIRTEKINSGGLAMDNVYIQLGVQNPDSPYTDTFRVVDENGNHPGHLGTIADHMITDAAPTINNIEGAILRDGQLPHYDTSGIYTDMVEDAAVRKHYYLEPGSAVDDAVSNTITSNNTNISFWNETLTTKYTDKLPTFENCIALIPVKDGGNKVRTFVTYDAADIVTGPFELGLSDASATHKSKYAIVGFNPQIKEDPDKVKALYDAETLVIPDKFAGINVQCVKHYAFYTPAKSNNGVEITYPDIDFDLSQVVSSDRCWPGQYSFAKTGIKKVAFSTKGKEGAWMQASAFEGCEKLTDVDLTNCKGGQVKVFKNCKNLTTVKADDLSAWAWGGTGQAFVGCEKLEELTFNLAQKSYIDHDLLHNAASLKTIKIMDATASNSLANKVALYAAAYDGTGDNKKLVEVSVLKKVNDSDNFRTLAIPQNGVSVKIFQLSADGKLIPYLVQGKTTPVTITIK